MHACKRPMPFQFHSMHEMQFQTGKSHNLRKPYKTSAHDSHAPQLYIIGCGRELTCCSPIGNLSMGSPSHNTYSMISQVCHFSRNCMAAVDGFIHLQLVIQSLTKRTFNYYVRKTRNLFLKDTGGQLWKTAWQQMQVMPL